MSADPSAPKKPKRPRTTAQSSAHVSSSAPRLPRVYRACESCRRKKVKCDGVEPVCGQCMGTVNVCTWKPTADRAAHSRQYVQELETQLHQYQELFQHVAPAVAQALGVEGTNGGQQSGGVEAAAAAREYLRAISQPAPAPSGEDEEDVDEEEGDEGESESTTSYDDSNEEDVTRRFGQLTLDENGHFRYIGSASALSLIETFRSISRRAHPLPPNPSTAGTASTYVNDLLFPPSIGIGKVRREYLPRSREAEYPPRDLADALINAYFDKFHPTLPVLDKVSFMEKYREHMDSGAYRDDAGFQSTIFGAFAVAARFVNDPRLGDGGKDGGLGSTFYDRAMILHFIGATKTQLSHVQCVVLLASYLASWNCLPEAWLLLGQAVRTAQDLGLHRAVTKSPLTPLEVEMYKRIWWCVYILDRFLAIALGRPLGIEDSDCDVDFPTTLDDEDLRAFLDGRPPTPPRTSTLMVGFNALARLAMLGGQMMRQVYAVGLCAPDDDRIEQVHKTVDRLDEELTRWCDSLPASLRSKPTGQRETVMAAVLCTSYYSVLISLHRVFLPTGARRHHHGSHTSAAVTISVQKAVSASRNCILLAKALRNIIFPSHHLAFFVQYLFSSAAILCLCVLRYMDERALQQTYAEVDQCIECLTALESSYPGAAKCRELLLKLVEVTKEYAAKKRDRGHLARTGSTRKPRRQSNRTTSSGGTASPNDFSGKRPHITPPRDVGPSVSSQNRVSPRQTAPQHSHLHQSTPIPPTAQAGPSSAQYVYQSTSQRPTFSSNPLRSAGAVLPPALSTPAYPIQSPSASASVSSFSAQPQMDSHTGQKRSRQESAADNIVGSSYIPTFGPNQQLLRQTPTHGVPAPISLPPSNLNPGIAPSLTSGADFRLPPSSFTPTQASSQGSSGSATPSYNMSNVPPDWGTNVQIKHEPGTSPGQAGAGPATYSPSPPGVYGSYGSGGTPPYLSGSTPPYASGSNGLPLTPFDVEGLSLAPFDMEFMNSIGQGWLDVPMDDSLGMDPNAFSLGFEQEPVFPFTLNQQGTNS